MSKNEHIKKTSLHREGKEPDYQTKGVSTLIQNSVTRVQKEEKDEY